MGLCGRPRTYHPERPSTSAERQRVYALKRQQEFEALRQHHAMKVYHQSKRHDWETPPEVFAEYDREFGFTLDACASPQNAKCTRFFTPEDNGLLQDWGTHVVWMNPPYGSQIAAWMEKAYMSSLAGATVVCLVPSRTGTAWWHRWARKGEIRERRGRITFVGAPNPAGFASVAVIFRPPA